ncbi:hypothetical protein MAMC_00353 [Methylacidimicrobium cyclopophantes]|uniref:AsmA-like C-terminal domain-containing protein n=1 Tax=Methylacidimicrobium cyclopophantes TaxID=1041766 RepID=A0A5E6M7R9_9BACT|nr:hypothetical protein [Methylacidimicrobium cyclopophantes]VVM04982.1 hypothetical protein MAMC_00353 [Methylacidimicrobium cyclopophantes]
MTGAGQEPRAGRPRKRSFSRRIGFPLEALLLLALLLFYGAPWAGRRIQSNTAETLTWLARRLELPLDIDSAEWFSPTSFRLHGVSLGDVGLISEVLVRWRWDDLLLRQRLSFVEIGSPTVWSSALIAFLERESKGGRPHPWLRLLPKARLQIDTLRVVRATINIDRLAPHLPPIPLALGFHGQPIELHDIPIVGLSRDDRLLNVAAARNVMIYSPYDPLSKILTIESLRVKFSWRGLSEHRIDQLALFDPVLYLGPDLFWYVDQFRKEEENRRQKGRERTLEQWTADKVLVRGGQFLISAFGTPGVVLPFLFGLTSENVPLNDWTQASLKNEIEIMPGKIEYPSYHVVLDVRRGRLSFNLPVSEHRANNLVHTVFFNEVSWRGITATDDWLDVTFNSSGIFGHFGGNLYGGYGQGGFSIEFQNDFPWVGWMHLTGVDVAPIAQKLTSDRFAVALTGKADGRLRLEARGTSLQNAFGFLTLAGPGRLEMRDIDSFLRRLPADWPPAKRELMQMLAQSLRSYSYSLGFLSLSYGLPESRLRLELRGPEGKRNFTIRWQQDPGMGRPIASGLSLDQNSDQLPEQTNGEYPPISP